MPASTTMRGLRQTGALALSIVLLCAVPAVAEPTTSTPVPDVVDPTPDPTPDAAPDATPDDTGSTTADDTPISVEIDTETAEFRAKLAAHQAELDELNAKLDELDRELGLAAEAYNRAVEQLAATRQEVSDTQLNLDKANEAYALQLELLSSRAKSMYQDGTFAAIELLLDSKSLSDFVARVKFLNTIGIADAEVAQTLRSQKDFIQQAVTDLEDNEKQAEALEFELKARQIEVMLRIQERQDMLDSAQAELLELLESEASRRQSAESALLREILSGANEAGVVVASGSPVETVLAYHGIPYLWGGATPAGFDCSGLIMYVYRQHGVELPHYSGSQFLLGERVLPSELAPGDVVFFGSPIHHVGMYIGGDYFVHAPRTGDFVKISRLSDRSDYAGARRYNWVTRTSPPAGVASDPIDLIEMLAE